MMRRVWLPLAGRGPMWVANPSSQRTCTFYSLPVSRCTPFDPQFRISDGEVQHPGSPGKCGLSALKVDAETMKLCLSRNELSVDR